MKATVCINNIKVEVDFSKGKDISIPLIFNGKQPNTYEVSKAISEAYKDGKFIGDTRKGGPCNFETYTLTPHCNGTHTECIGHITKERINILSSLEEELIPSTVISIIPEKTNEKYHPELQAEELLITKKQLEKKLTISNPDFIKGLIIRTLPNTQTKKERDYMKYPSCFFSIQAMEYIVDLGIKHLLIDTPSVDKLFDEGILSSHNIFWETKDKIMNKEAQHKTITEMIFVDNHIEDGVYLLNLQIPPFVADAAPSRPIIYRIDEL